MLEREEVHDYMDDFEKWQVEYELWAIAQTPLYDQDEEEV